MDDRDEGPSPDAGERPDAGDGPGPGDRPDLRSWLPSRTAVGIAMVLAGVIWSLQGLGILTAGDSFMIGDPIWVVIGAAFVLAGAALAVRARQRA